MYNLFKWFGFGPRSDEKPFDYKHKNYTQSEKSGRLDAHLAFLKSIEIEETSRLTIIESKTSQIVSQTGIIFSLLSLFIPVFITKMSDQTLWLKILFLILLLLAFAAYFLTIHHAIANYNVKKFIYSKSSPNNVLKYQKESTNEFKKIEIQDLLYSINQNEFTNNRKADNLIYSYRSFKIGNLLTAILVLILCSSLLFVENKVESIRIADPVKIENLHQSKQIDSLARELIENLKSKQQLRGSDSAAQIVY